MHVGRGQDTFIWHRARRLLLGTLPNCPANYRGMKKGGGEGWKMWWGCVCVCVQHLLQYGGSIKANHISPNKRRPRRSSHFHLFLCSRCVTAVATGQPARSAAADEVFLRRAARRRERFTPYKVFSRRRQPYWGSRRPPPGGVLALAQCALVD